ncbi:MAG TPA: response regulator, partial [Spirochaetia bacterium]|nr:response regulator [Spirochaetia bacterium]
GHLEIKTANVDLDDTFVLEHRGAKPGPHVMLSVSDNGCGMSAEVRSHLFEPFYTTKEPGKGTGLGLSTVYGIVKQSEGYIAVDSREGVGTTVTLFLPRAEGSPESTVKRPVLQKEVSGSETILLVEDDEGVIALAQHVLSMKGYHVISARDGPSALQICSEHAGAINLLITDVVMPGLGGRELARQILALNPNIKVLFLSGYSEDAILHQGLLEPGTAFLQKPFSADSLPRKAREVLDTPR